MCNCEDRPCCGCGADDTSYEPEPYDGGGWPGDGSGTDDLADMNANEADDYRDEGNDDASFEAYEGGFNDE
jgi:hypothetical protein